MNKDILVKPKHVNNKPRIRKEVKYSDYLRSKSKNNGIKKIINKAQEDVQLKQEQEDMQKNESSTKKKLIPKTYKPKYDTGSFQSLNEGQNEMT